MRSRNDSTCGGLFRLCMAALFSLGTSGASALERPVGSPGDGRIQVVDFDDGNVVAVHVAVGHATQIRLGAGEEVLDVATGFTLGWEIVTRRNNVYLKARSVKGEGEVMTPSPGGLWDTNLIVTTSTRTYAFQLMVVAEHVDARLGYDPRITFRVEFRFPAEIATKAQAVAEERAKERAHQRRRPPVNWDYTMQVASNSDSIIPSAAYDDGEFTFLRFPRHGEFPTVFIVTNGAEAIVNSHVDPEEPDVLVVQRVAGQFMLRLGDAVVGVFNESFDSGGRVVRRGPVRLEGGREGTYSEMLDSREEDSVPRTSIPGVERVVREAASEGSRR